MTLLAGFLAGAVTAGVGWRLLRPSLHQPGLLRPNHRGAPVPTAGGVVVAVSVLAVEAVWAVVATARGDGGLPAGHLPVVVAVVGFALLGLLDDLGGAPEDPKGFGGHLRALRGGRLTTGAVKLAGGVAVAVLVAVVAVAAADGADAAGAGLAAAGQVAVDALVVALSANLANLLDRAPGRTGKAALVALAGIVMASAADPVLGAVAVAGGAAAALLAADLRERVMLGDTGANALGGALGVGVILVASPFGRGVAAAVLLALNLASEVVSFSRVIEAVPPLRMLDRAGRLPPGAPRR